MHVLLPHRSCCPTPLRAAPHVLCVEVGPDLYQGLEGIQVAPQGCHMHWCLTHLQQHDTQPSLPYGYGCETVAVLMADAGLVHVIKGIWQMVQ
jgi:hypothetical protein